MYMTHTYEWGSRGTPPPDDGPRAAHERQPPRSHPTWVGLNVVLHGLWPTSRTPETTASPTGCERAT